ncbi:MAG: ion transporter, partial [Eubacteriaceae bacterium]
YKKLKRKMYKIIFESDTPKGKAFDIALLIAILLSTFVVLLQSVERINIEYGAFFSVLEWFFLIVFTVEYILRIICVDKPVRYIKSFFGIIDLLAILPMFIGMFITAAQILLIVRVLRLFRLLRVLKMSRFLAESNFLLKALKSSMPKIILFISTMVFVIIIAGSIMYVIEGPQSGYTSIPQSMYWAVVTVTTVGYGDISPQTTLGKLIASLLMISSYGILAVPTGIITYELAQTQRKATSNKDKAPLQRNEEKTKTCTECLAEGLSENAVYCSQCGKKI